MLPPLLLVVVLSARPEVLPPYLDVLSMPLQPTLLLPLKPPQLLPRYELADTLDLLPAELNASIFPLDLVFSCPA